MENMIKQIAKAMIAENNVEQLVALSYNEPLTEGDAIVLKAAKKAEQWLFYSQKARWKIISLEIKINKQIKTTRQ